jgi:AcrR family transcriptional regulator
LSSILEEGAQAMAVGISGEVADPRIRRTRRLLQDALRTLLEKEDFDKISVTDIDEAATVNRVTFYDHYTDKYGLLECLVGTRFQELIRERGIQFECSSALRAIVLAVCDYVGGAVRMGSSRHPQMEPHLESALIAVVRRMFLDGFRRHSERTPAALEMLATTLSWAIYGAAQEWARQSNRCSSDEIAGTISKLVAPILDQLQAHQPTP